MTPSNTDIVILPATLPDMEAIAANMREADRREITAVFPFTDAQIAGALYEGSKDLAWTAWTGGGPVCAFGVSRLLPGLGSGWAYGTRKMPAVMKAVTRFCLRKVMPLCVREGFRRVEVRSIEDHDISHRWLEYLGFECEGMARGYGAIGDERLDYVMYAARRNPE